MRARIRSIGLAIATASFVAASAVVGAACGDDGSERATFPVDSGTDGANLPPDGTVDAGPTLDARPPFDPKDEPVTCAATPCVVQLVAGFDHFCALLSDGTVRCWGDDVWGQLGHGEPGETPPGLGIPPVVRLSDVTQISAAARTTCARLSDGSVQCWGSNFMGELGLDPIGVSDEVPHPIPTPVALDGAAVTRIDVGQWNVCAALADGQLSCWGNDEHLKLVRPDGGGPGDGMPVILGPGIAELDPSVIATSYGGTRTMLALTKSGEVLSWGAIAGDDGLVSGRISSKSPDLEPQKIEELAHVTSIAVSPILWRESMAKESGDHRPGNPGAPPHAHACAIANGEVYCWGHSFTGALCNGLPDKQQQPVLAPVSATAWPQQVAVGDETTCLRMTDGTVMCCGEDTNGALGKGEVTGFGAFFARASSFTKHAVHLAASNSAICALVQGGTVECWGGNRRGELGFAADNDPHPTPTKVAF